MIKVILGILLRAFAGQYGKTGLCIHQDTGHGVSLAGEHMVVLHLVGDGGLGIGDDGLLTEAADALGRLLGEDVALESVSSLDLAGFRQIEALLGAAVSLQF